MNCNKCNKPFIKEYDYPDVLCGKCYWKKVLEK